MVFVLCTLGHDFTLGLVVYQLKHPEHHEVNKIFFFKLIDEHKRLYETLK